MKILAFCFALVGLSAAAEKAQTSTCAIEVDGSAFNDWVTLKSNCLSEINRQIKEEIGASLSYLHMAGHFSTDEINRPGFAKKFFEAASEEREHAIKLIEYLSMRGENADDIPDFRQLPAGWSVPYVTNGNSSLLEALAMETKVTNSIVEVIKVCEDEKKCDAKDGVGCPPKLTNDYHLVDYLTGVYLEEQYHGQKELANHFSTLNKMIQNHPEMGEFLFDKKLLLGE